MGGTPNLAGPTGVTCLSLRSMSPNFFDCSDKFFLLPKKLKPVITKH